MNLVQSALPDMNLMLEERPVEMTRSHNYNRNGYEASLHVDYAMMDNLRNMELVQYSATESELNRINIPI